MGDEFDGYGVDGPAPEESLETPAAESAETIEADVQQLQQELEQLKDLYLRKLAEFDNFRKRVERERRELEMRAGERVVGDLVPVLDNFDRALAHAEETDAAGFRQGIGMIARQLWDVLQRQGMAVMDPLGEVFDPELHQAVERIEDAGQEPGTIVAVRAKGYAFAGRLVRPAMVAVVVEPTLAASAPEEPAE